LAGDVTGLVTDLSFEDALGVFQGISQKEVGVPVITIIDGHKIGDRVFRALRFHSESLDGCRTGGGSALGGGHGMADDPDSATDAQEQHRRQDPDDTKFVWGEVFR
jgi:hypothetical protein